MKLIFTLLFLTPAISTASTPNSEFFYQTPKGAHYTSITATSGSSEIQMQGSHLVKTSTTGLAVYYEYGYLENFAYGAKIAYSNADADSDQDTKGISDLTLHGSSFYQIDDTMNLHYGASISTTIGEKSSTPTTVDATSGGSSLSPFLGWSWKYAINSFGAKIESTIFSSERKTLSSSGKTLETGGESQIVSLYHEWPTQSGHIGTVVRHTHTASTQNTTSGTSVSNNNASDQFSLELATSHDFNDVYTFAATLGTSRYLNKDIGGVDIEKDSNLWVNIGLEITLQ